MNETTSAKASRVSLTKKQLETALGAELLSLCQGITADGTLTAEELQDLRTWIGDHSADDLPAIAHVRGVLEQVLADGKITPDEVTLVHKALESVLPMELRKTAKEARREREQAERDAARAAKAATKERERAERERNRPLGSANFMVAGVRHEGRPAIIDRYVSEGDPAFLRRDRANEYSAHAVAVYTASGHQVGFMPEEYAQQWATDIDAGAKVEAIFKKVLTGGRSPIPVVQAYFYRGDADVETVPAAAPSPKAVTRFVPRWVWWVVVIALAVWWMTANLA